MQITIDLPDNLPLTEPDVRIELASELYQQHSYRDWNIEVRSGVIFKFYGLACGSQIQIDFRLRGQFLGAIGFSLRERLVSFVKDRKGWMSLILFFARLSAINLVKDCKGLTSLIFLLSRVSSVRLESFRLAASHSVVPASFNSTSTVCLVSGLKAAFSRHPSPNVLFASWVSAAIALNKLIAIDVFLCKYKCHHLL